MVKKLTRTGNSVAVVLDKEILEATGLDESSSVEISTDGRVIFITPPTNKKRAAQLKEIMEDVERRFHGAFKKLADS